MNTGLHTLDDRILSCHKCDISYFCKNPKIGPREHVPFDKKYKPLDILFVGEAAGASEHIIGKPFVGPAGHELNSLIEETIDPSLAYAIINAVLCTPFDDDTQSDIRTPFLPEIEACREHLQSYIELKKPRRIVALGKIAERSLKKLKLTFVTVLHPSAILQSSHPALAHARVVLTLKDISNALS